MKSPGSGQCLLILLLLLSIHQADGFFLGTLVWFSDLLWDIGLVFPSPFLLFPELRCQLRILFLDFDFRNVDRYDRYFRDDTTLTIAETGTYQNVKNIREYISFVLSRFNPFFDEDGSEQLAGELSFVGYEDGQCVFLNQIITLWKLEDSLTVGGEVEFGFYNKIFFDFNNRYFYKIDSFFTTAFVEWLFGTAFDTNSTRAFVCEAMVGDVCQALLNSTSTQDACKTQLAALPSTEANGYVDGNTQGCRAIHSFLALSDPELHCPHIALTATSDPFGKIKCQESEGVLPSDLFTDRDRELFLDFMTRQGLDPAIGFKASA